MAERTAARAAVTPIDVNALLAERPVAGLAAHHPTMRERFGNAIYDLARWGGLGSIAHRMRQQGGLAADFLPGLGDVLALEDAAQDYGKGDYGKAAAGLGLAAIGLVPGAGDLVSKGMKKIAPYLPLSAPQLPEILDGIQVERGMDLFTLRGVKNAFPDITESQAKIIRDQYRQFLDAQYAHSANESKNQLKYVRKLIKENDSLIGNIHKLDDLEFKPIPVDKYKSIPKKIIHKSPTHNRRQSSEYAIGIIDGAPVYIRKADHWGKFGTNVTDIEEAVKMGVPRDEAERLAMEDPFGRITKKYREWRLTGGADNRKSQVGIIPIDDALLNKVEKSLK